MTDDEIRALIHWQYDRGRTPASPMAEIIFKIAVMVRDICQRPESKTILNLRERLEAAERSAKYAWEAAEREKNTDWRERYHQLHKMYAENFERRKQERKEVRRFRLANFSVDELRAELTRRQASTSPDLWTPVDDGHYGDGIIKGCQVQISEDGREVRFAMRSRTHSHRWEGFLAVPGVRLCKQAQEPVKQYIDSNANLV